MKTYKYLYQKMLDENIIRQAYKKLRKGKTKRVEIKYIDNHLDEEVRKMKAMIENTKPCEVEHPELAYKPIYHKPKIIKEHIKQRTIYMPEIHEQWLHHIIIRVLQPIILRTTHPNVCGCYPGRGPHYGKRIIERWIRSRRGIRYFAKLDIRHFYDNIRHKVLFRELRKHIEDEWFLYIIKLCISQFKKGLPLGYRISPELANYMLEPLDKMISKYAKKYIRYVDDIVIYGNSIERIKIVVNKISEMLGYRFYLKLKGNFQVTKFDRLTYGRPLDFMGFVFYRNRIIMRKSIMLKATRLARKIDKKHAKGYRIYRKWISGFVSYMGWFTHTDSYTCYLDYIKPYIKVGYLKRVISAIDRRKNDDRMDGNEVLRKTRANIASSPRIIYAS